MGLAPHSMNRNTRTQPSMSYAEEFATVDLIVVSGAETCGVDAFALSLIKAERQIRKLFTHLVFQFPAFDEGDVAKLRKTLADNRQVYFEGFVAGWDALYPRAMRELVGSEYEGLWTRLKEAIDHRNKIFHGQLTTKSLSREALLEYVENVRSWCSTLARSALTEVGYDGFGRNSFRKSTISKIWGRFKVQIESTEEYGAFIRRHMQRPKSALQRTAHGQSERCR